MGILDMFALPAALGEALEERRRKKREIKHELECFLHG